MITLVVANQKGGVGKTTTAVNLAASLAATKRKVLLIDIDSQANATTGSGHEKAEDKLTIMDVLARGANIKETILPCTDFGFDLVPSCQDLISADIEMITVPAASLQLKNALRSLEGSYDYVIIDCPPSLGILTLNALRASSKLIIPMQCEYYAMEGLVSLNKAINDINSKTGENIQISAILRTMFDPRARLTREVSEELQKYFPNELCSTVIPRNVKLAEAPSSGKPGLFYDPKAKGTVAYLALAGEVISKFEKDSMVA